MDSAAGLLSLSSLLVTSSLSCQTDLSCSLAGRCLAGSCHCRPPWSGPRCSRLEERPVTFPQGYGQHPVLTSWGGDVISDGLNYHLFVSRMTNNCSLRQWRTNSRIDHGVSQTITGPYTFSDVAVPVWAHNPDIVRLPDNTFAIVHIGDGSGGSSGGDICHNDLNHLEEEEEEGGRRGSTIHTSDSLYGPWRPLENSVHCNNPSLWVHHNQSILLLCFVGNGLFELNIADNISGPWLTTTTIDVNSLVETNSSWEGTAFEDPSLWQDSEGHYHILCHAYKLGEERSNCDNSTVSAHLFSLDGLAWSLSPDQPYSTRINTLQGGEITTLTVSTRERPRPVLMSGMLTHLVTSVCSSPSCPDGPPAGCVDCKYDHWDFTLLTPLSLQ